MRALTNLKYLLLLTATLLLSVVGAEARQTYDLSHNWKFFTHSESESHIVNLPHQWNLDALSGKADYYRGEGNYMRYIDAKPEWRQRRVYIRFEGASLVTDLLVNGRYVGRHEGGSNAFTFEIGDLLGYNGRDLIWIIVNNGKNIDVMPTEGNGINYGGLFREVKLIVEEPTHFALEHYSSNGIYINTKELSTEVARGEVEVKVSAKSVVSGTIDLTISDADGNEVFATSQRVRTINGTTTAYIPFEVANPTLWHGTANPAMYSFTATLSTGDEVKDKVRTTYGFRTIAVGNEGIMLNGEPYPVRGVLLHRDRPLCGNAIYARDIEEDLAIAVEMGANTVRIVGGTHHPRLYDICNDLGLLVINDLPFIGSTTINGKGFFNTEAFRQNGKEQLSEMIYQLYNHPSVAVWNLFSEMEVRGESPVAFIRELNSLAKRIDPARLTCGWSNQDGEINFITDLVVWSHVFGWTDGLPEDIAVWQEQIHNNPDWRALRSGVSYKCGGSIFHQSDLLEKPVANSHWHPERWQAHFHDTYLASLAGDELFWGLFVDSLFDYPAVDASRASGRMSDMGLVSFNRQERKDAFYRYKGAWNRNDEFVHIAEKRWSRRLDTLQTIKVYTNLPTAELTLNGEFVGQRENEGGVMTWSNLDLERGINRIEVTSRGLTDSTVIEIPENYSVEL